MPRCIPDYELDLSRHEIVGGPFANECQNCGSSSSSAQSSSSAFSSSSTAALDPNQVYAGCPAIVVTGGPEWANGTYKVVGSTDANGVFTRSNTYPTSGTYLKEITELTEDGVVPPIYFEFSYVMGIPQWYFFNRNLDQQNNGNPTFWSRFAGYYVGYDSEADAPMWSDTEGGEPRTPGELAAAGPQSGSFNGTGYATEGTLTLTIVPQANCNTYWPFA